MSKDQEAKKQAMAVALRDSLKNEEKAIEDKFLRAEKAFAAPERATPASTPQTRTTVVRDTFSMPDNDYSLISKLRQRCLSYGIASTKSGIVRAGLNALNSMNENQLRAVLSQLEQVKPGRTPG